MAAKNVMINPDPFCEVDMQSMEAVGLPDKYVIRLRDPETQEMVPINTKGAIHGQGYRLVQNSRVDQITRDVLTRTGMTWEPLPKYGQSKVTDREWDGKKFAQRFYIPEVNVNVDEGEGTKLMLGVEAVNSYDGSYGVALQFFMMSMACSNQFRPHNFLGGFNFRHHEAADQSLEADLRDASDLLMQQAEKFGTIGAKVDRLLNTTLEEAFDTNDRMSGFLSMRSSLGKSWRPSYDSHVLDELAHQGVTSRMGRGQTSHTDNLWGTLNAYTAVATHHIGGFNGVSVNRDVTDKFLEKVSD
jgi:hypothetical protein